MATPERPAKLTRPRSEGLQIGLRLAHRPGFEGVSGIDQQRDAIDRFRSGEVPTFARPDEGADELGEAIVAIRHRAGVAREIRNS